MDLIRYSELMEKGLLPVAGGVVDQTAWFIEAATFFQQDCERIKAERSRDDGH